MDIQKMIDNLPAGLDRAILRVLSFHTGREHAISRDSLRLELDMIGFRLHERAMRAAINQLRKAGQPICSTGGDGGGYYLASDWSELTEFLDREVRPRAMDLLEQEKALKAAAERRWGRYAPERQPALF